MPYNSRDPNANTGTSPWKLDVPRNVAIAVLVALVVLWALRHVFGTVTVSAGSN